MNLENDFGIGFDNQQHFNGKHADFVEKIFYHVLDQNSFVHYVEQKYFDSCFEQSFHFDVDFEQSFHFIGFKIMRSNLILNISSTF